MDSLGDALYFDSYGIPPFVADHIKRLRKNCKQFRWNAVRLQSDSSDVCGQYCLMFLYFMSSGVGFQEFLNHFSADFDKNDELVQRFIKYKNADDAFVGNGSLCNQRCLQMCRAKLFYL